MRWWRRWLMRRSRRRRKAAAKFRRSLDANFEAIKHDTEKLAELAAIRTCPAFVGAGVHSLALYPGSKLFHCSCCPYVHGKEVTT